MRPALLRALLVPALAILGLVAGLFAGMWAVPKDTGLAGGAIVVGYGAVGLALALIAGILMAVLAAPAALRLSALIAVPLAVAAAIAIGILIWLNGRPPGDPESAYAGLPSYRVTLEQITITDPYLATRVEIDTGERTWRTQLPDSRVCTGVLRAEVQKFVADALGRFVAQSDRIRAECGGEPATQRLAWRFEPRDGQPADGEFSFSQACSDATPALGAFVAALRLAPSKVDSGPACE